MAPTRLSMKRVAGSIDDDDVITPKKEKQTPGKKTPKVVQMKSDTPRPPISPSAAVASPVSDKKAAKKTPLKAKTPNGTQSNNGTPKVGKLSEPSPLQTRSARKKKAELNATIATPSKAVTPVKGAAAKKLNTLAKAGTPSAAGPKKQTPGKGKKVVEEEDDDDDEEEDDLDLALGDDMDSDDLDSDDDLDEEDEVSEDDDDESEGMESEEDEIEAEKRKAELEAILNKPGNRKSILKGVKDSPVPVKKVVDNKSPATKTASPASNLAAKSIKVETPSKNEADVKTPAKGQAKTPIKQETTPALVKTPVTSKSPATKSPALETATKSPAVQVSAAAPTKAATPQQQPATTPKKMKASDFFDLEAVDEQKKKIKSDKTPTGTPAAKETAPGKKTPKGQKNPELKAATPAKEDTDKKVQQTPKSQKKAAQTPEPKGTTPATPETKETAPSSEKTAKPAETKKAKQKAKKAAKKAAALAAGAQSPDAKKTKPVEAEKVNMDKPKKAEKVNMDKPKKGDEVWFPKEVLLVNKANEERFAAIREKLVAAGKTAEEIAVELPRIKRSMLKRLESTRCLRCRKRGHMQKDCPTAKAQIKCYKCGKADHTAKACSIKQEIFTYADCYLCKQTGHLTRTCPSNKNGIYPKGGSCFKCGEKTHLAKDCTKAQLTDENTKPVEKPAPMVGLLDSKQSGDADVEMSTPGSKKKANQIGGKKKAVVKF